jgi:hypothetical protein
MSGGAPVLLAALAGGLALVAAREAIAATPAAARWLALAIEPLRRAGREGYAPTEVERRRLAAVGAGAMLVAGLVLLGPGPASLLAIAGPAAVTAAISRRRTRYRLAVERGLPEVATCLADTVAAGRSVRAALSAAATSVEGPPAVEMARVRAELDLGVPTRGALDAWQRPDALAARRRSRGRAALGASWGRGSGLAPAALWRGGGRARPSRCGCEVGNRASSLHRPARRRDAGRSGRACRAPGAGIRRWAARRSCRVDDPRLRRGPPVRRLRRDSQAQPGHRAMTSVGR